MEANVSYLCTALEQEDSNCYYYSFSCYILLYPSPLDDDDAVEEAEGKTYCYYNYDSYRSNHVDLAAAVAAYRGLGLLNLCRAVSDCSAAEAGVVAEAERKIVDRQISPYVPGLGHGHHRGVL